MFKQHYFITNISKNTLTIRDLGIVLRPNCTVNIFGKKIRFTIAQAENSINYGSVCKLLKDKNISITYSKPEPNEIKIEVSKDYRPTKFKSLVAIEEKKFEELEWQDTNDEAFAEMSVDDAIADHSSKLNIPESNNQKEFNLEDK